MSHECAERDALLDVVEETNGILRRIAEIDGTLTDQLSEEIDRNGTIVAANIGVRCAAYCRLNGPCFLTGTEQGAKFREFFEAENKQVSDHLRSVEPVVTIELPNVSGEELKDIVMRRVGVLGEPGLVEKLVAVHNRDNPAQQMSVEDFNAYMQAYITPAKDDETWEVFAQFIKGNIRAGLAIFSFFQRTHAMARGSDPESVATTEWLAHDFVERDGNWRHTRKGFRPANPYQITVADFHKLAGIIDDKGWLNLPDGVPGLHAYSMVKVTDDPEEYAQWRLGEDGALTLIEGNAAVLPPDIRLKAIEALSSVVSQEETAADES